MNTLLKNHFQRQFQTLDVDGSFDHTQHKVFTYTDPLVMQSSQNGGQSPSHGFDLEDEVETAEPALYKVILLNDDYTPMDFVIYVLKTFFKHDDQSAEKIMLDVHRQGSGVAGIYTFEVAETKSLHVNQFSKTNKYPLKSIIEEDKSEG